ncbi:MAG: tRNA dihydrouridine synthase DusB [Bdellovibrionaceae bacterium]|nr:tRNA dihydrouridine synthase DusB [Pseudobdellovibrionaceae bacterium]
MTEVELLHHLKHHPFVLAPMAGITDMPFRAFMNSMGAGVVVSELVSANGIKYGGENTLKLLDYEESERPVGLQLFGEDPEVLADAARKVQELGADFVDLNFGCPVKKVVQKGGGSAVLKDIPHLQKILRAVKSAITIPLTIKIRTGWDQNQRNAVEVIKVAYDEGVTWVAIHGRTRSQGYSGSADWEFIASIKAVSPIPIIGNGDITSAEMAVNRLHHSQCDGVMIGRGCLKNPWIFQEARNLLYGLPLQAGIDYNYLPVLRNLKERLERTHDERTVVIQLRKFGMWYSAGFPESSKFRSDIFSTKTIQDTFERIENYYTPLMSNQRLDTSHESFLMGGHG